MLIGWNMVIETTNGVVGLWTSWLEKSLKLYYPLGVEFPDEIVMETLGVTYAKPVHDEKFGSRKWAKYYSEKLELGRVWIDQADEDMYGNHLGTIENQRLVEHYCGHSETNTITTFDFSFCSELQPDAPTNDPKYIQPYKNKFVELLIKIAKIVGDIKAVDFDSGCVLYTPKLLEEKGYQLTSWEENYKSFHYASDENCEIVLKQGNEIVPWITYIRFKANNDLTAEDLLEFVDGFGDEECSMNLAPLVKGMIEKATIYQN